MKSLASQEAKGADSLSTGKEKSGGSEINVLPSFPKTRCNVFCRSSELLASLAYLLASILLTWPLFFKLGSVLFGDYGDTRGGVWWVWAKTNGLLDASINHLIASPFGIPTVRGFRQPVTEWLPIILSKFSNEIVAYNLYVFLSFPLTAIATYFLLERLLQQKLAAFVGGLIFGFCPAAVMQAAGGHAAFSFNAFIPLFLLALFYNRSHRTLLSVFYVAASFTLITFTTLYFGYFAIYITIFFVIFDVLNSKAESKHAISLNYLYGAIFAIVLILPFEYKAIFKQITLSNDTLAKAGHIRDLSELFVYSSRPWDFLTPSVDHPVFGAFLYDFTRAHLHGSNIFEQTLYLGMIPVGLLLTGIVLTFRGSFNVGHRTYFMFFMFGALWMYFLSLPPLLTIGSGKVPTVSYFAYYIAPMFRVYARFGILVNFFVACAAAVVLTHLSQRMKRARYFALLALLLPVLMFEYWSVPPDFALAVDRPPEVYQWLAKEPGNVIVAEYPMMRWDELSFYTYLFWQRIHKKSLVNGASKDNALAWPFFAKVNDLANPETPELLKSVGVKYVIVHTKMYQDGTIPGPIKRYFPEKSSLKGYNGGKMPIIPSSLKLIKKFGTDMVFSLEDIQVEVDSKETVLPVHEAH